MPKLSITKEFELSGHKDCIYGLAHSENKVYSAGGDGYIVEWDLDDPGNGKLIATFPTSIYALYHIPESDFLAVGLSKGGFYLLDLKSSRPFKNYQRDYGTFSFNTDESNRYLFVAGEKGNLNRIDLKNFDCQPLESHTHSNIRKLILSESGKLAMPSSDGFMRIFNENAEDLLFEWKAHEKAVFSAMWLNGEEKIITGSMDAHLNIWEKEGDGYDRFLSIPAHQFTLNDLAYIPQLGLFASAGRDNDLKIWSAENFDILKVVNAAKHGGHKHSVNAIWWDGEREILISASDDRRLIGWRINEL